MSSLSKTALESGSNACEIQNEGAHMALKYNMWWKSKNVWATRMITANYRGKHRGSNTCSGPWSVTVCHSCFNLSCLTYGCAQQPAPNRPMFVLKFMSCKAFQIRIYLTLDPIPFLFFFFLAPPHHLACLLLLVASLLTHDIMGLNPFYLSYLYLP